MIKELKQILKRKNISYLAYVRRITPQYLTIDVEIISDAFNENIPNENYFINGVRTGPFTNLLGDGSSSLIPKENTYCIITHLDSSENWILIKSDELALQKVTNNNIIINTKDTFTIDNPDIIQFKKRFRLGIYETNYDILEIRHNKIILKGSEKYINISNNIEFNSLEKGLYMYHSKYKADDSVKGLTDLLTATYDNYLSTLMYSYTLNKNLSSYYSIFFIWSCKNYPNDHQISAGRMLEWLSTIPEWENRDVNSLSNYLIRQQADIINSGYTLFNYMKHIKRIRYHIISSAVMVEINNINSREINTINALAAIPYNSAIDTAANYYYDSILYANGQNIQNILYNADVNYSVNYFRMVNDFIDSISVTDDIKNKYIEFMSYSVDENSIVFNNYKSDHVGGAYDKALMIYFIDTILALLNVISYATGKKTTATDNITLNFGNMLDDIINSMQNYKVIVTNTSIPSSAPGIPINGYYSDVKLKSNSLYPKIN